MVIAMTMKPDSPGMPFRKSLPPKMKYMAMPLTALKVPCRMAATTIDLDFSTKYNSMIPKRMHITTINRTPQ